MGGSTYEADAASWPQRDGVYPARQQHAEIRRLHTLGQAD
jgi:hypothetical protein